WLATSNNAQPSHKNPANFVRNGRPVGPTEGYASQLVVDEAILWLDTKRDSKKPFFLNVWFHEPHAPLAAPNDIVSKYGALSDPTAIYSATIENTDRAVARLLKKLREVAAPENTIVIYSSDNGSYRADRVGELRGTKGSNYEGGIRVPGIVSWPGKIDGGHVEKEPAGLIDLLPTICGLTGIDKPKGVHLDGADLSPLLLGRPKEFRRAQPLAWILPASGPAVAIRDGRFVLVAQRDYKFPKNRKRMGELKSEIARVLRGKGTYDAELRGSTLDKQMFEGFKDRDANKLRGQFIRLNMFNESWIPSIHKGGYRNYRLYDLKNDIGQRNDVTKKHPDVAARLKTQLTKINRSVMSDAPDWSTKSSETSESPKKPTNAFNASTSPRHFRSKFAPLIESSCIDCHGDDTKTTLSFASLKNDLSDAETFRRWERIFDRVERGEMPPKRKARPDVQQLQEAQNSLRTALHEASLAQQERVGRVPLRRLTNLEYEYTLHDALGISTPLAKRLPPESELSKFDTVAGGQAISPVHIRSYLDAADVALNEAIQLGRRPPMQPRLLDYPNSKYIAMWFDRPIRNGGSTIKRVDDGVVTFEKKNHAMRSDNMGFRVWYPGQYRIEIEAEAYQAKTPVTLTLIRGSDKQGGSQLAGSFDLYPGKPRTVSLTTRLTPDDYLYPALTDDDCGPRGRTVYHRGAKFYKGEGVKIRKLTVQGPLEETWPPTKTRDLLHGIGFAQRPRWYQMTYDKPRLEHTKDVVGRLAGLLFRRPLKDGEVDRFVQLTSRSLEDGRGYLEALRVSMRSLLCSPQFLFLSGSGSTDSQTGPLDDFALASRLSYFLWKSLPDAALLRLAAEGQLSKPNVLAGEVNRLLRDPKSIRFLRDFLGQWIGLHDIDATTPDTKLYPEYDDVLRQAMLRETELFFRELVDENLPIRNLLHSDFTYLNRRLAVHYGIPGLRGERFRRVQLPADGVRGGLLTHASVLKITANGTVTSPVKRGTFVLDTLLGCPPSPPPPNIGSIEPDTRGTTTIRETLNAHRNTEACASCHREIDPPGFALESFDPIGGFRTRYRSTGKGDRPKRKFRGRFIYEYRESHPVDASGVTADGRAFEGIRDFRKELLKRTDDVARNVVSRLIVYSTGGEIQFADREEIERILSETRGDEYPLRSLIHRVVQSRLFRNK
ncbi:MAG: DUF1592 domain-containing protein, partial [Planctomycetota bacterium]